MTESEYHALNRVQAEAENIRSRIIVMKDMAAEIDAGRRPEITVQFAKGSVYVFGDAWTAMRADLVAELRSQIGSRLAFAEAEFAGLTLSCSCQRPDVAAAERREENPPPCDNCGGTGKERWSCKVCEATPDEHGYVEHGKGCYALGPDGGGVECPDLDPCPKCRPLEVPREFQVGIPASRPGPGPGPGPGPSEWFRCPKCGDRSMLWYEWGGVFLCREGPRCRATCPPHPDPAATGPVVQAWIDQRTVVPGGKQ